MSSIVPWIPRQLIRKGQWQQLIKSSVINFNKALTILHFFQVPELAGFWVLSIVLQLPLHLLLLFSSPMWPLPGETAIEIVMITLLVSQLLTGFFALRKSAVHQARRYHLAQVQNKSM